MPNGPAPDAQNGWQATTVPNSLPELATQIEQEDED